MDNQHRAKSVTFQGKGTTQLSALFVSPLTGFGGLITI